MHTWMEKLRKLLLIELRQIHMMAHLAMLAPNASARYMVLDLLSDELDEAKLYNTILCAYCNSAMPVSPGIGYQPGVPCPPGVAPGIGYQPGVPCPPYPDPCYKPGYPPGYLQPARPDATLAPSVPVDAPGTFPGLFPGPPPGIPLAEQEKKDDKK